MKNEMGPVSNNHLSLFPKNKQSKRHAIIMWNPKTLEINVIINSCFFFLNFSLYSYIKEYKINSLVLHLEWVLFSLLSPFKGRENGK